MTEFNRMYINYVEKNEAGLPDGISIEFNSCTGQIARVALYNNGEVVENLGADQRAQVYLRKKGLL